MFKQIEKKSGGIKELLVQLFQAAISGQQRSSPDLEKLTFENFLKKVQTFNDIADTLDQLAHTLDQLAHLKKFSFTFFQIIPATPLRTVILKRRSIKSSGESFVSSEFVSGVWIVTEASLFSDELRKRGARKVKKAPQISDELRERGVWKSDCKRHGEMNLVKCKFSNAFTWYSGSTQEEHESDALAEGSKEENEMFLSYNVRKNKLEFASEQDCSGGDYECEWKLSKENSDLWVPVRI